MLKRVKEGSTIATTLTINGQGESITVNVTFFNKEPEDLADAIRQGGEAGEDLVSTLAAYLLSLVAEWESEYPLTIEGIKLLEKERPQTTMAMIQGYHRSRRMELAKN